MYPSEISGLNSSPTVLISAIHQDVQEKNSSVGIYSFIQHKLTEYILIARPMPGDGLGVLWGNLFFP